MAAPTAAFLSAAARRLSRSTASTMVVREVTGSHKLTIDGCKASKNIPRDWYWFSQTFDAGGCSWRIRYFPRGGSGYISLDLEHEPSSSKDKVGSVQFKFSLLDLAGNPVPEFTKATTEPCPYSPSSRSHGFEYFVSWKDLEASGCLADDRFTVRCDVTVTTDLAKRVNDEDADHPAPRVAVAVPPPDLHRQLYDLLWKGRGTDVTVDVGGEAFDAHGWLLAARSPFFEAELLATAAPETEKHTAGAGAAGPQRRRIEVQGVEPEVFGSVLHYMYTDSLPAEKDEGAAAAMAPALLAAARRFRIDRLGLMCEEMLCRRIDVGTAADTQAVAERHGCRGLKATCLEFMACPENLKAVMATQGFERLKAECPALLTELVLIKQLAA